MSGPADSAVKRNPNLWVSTLYYNEGYPLAFVLKMGSIFFTYMNVPVEVLGVFAGIFNLPWSFKFIWSPLVDFAGTKRRWILAMQGGLALIFLAVALVAFYMPAGRAADAPALALRLLAPGTEGLWPVAGLLLPLILLFSIGTTIDRSRGRSIRSVCLALCAACAIFLWFYGGKLVMSVEFLLPVHIWLIAAGFLAAALLSATHDVAIDGYYIDVLDRDCQAQFSGMRIAAYRVALVVGGGLLVLLEKPAGWGTVFGLGGAVFLALGIFHAFYLPMAPAASTPAGSAGGRSIVKAFTSYIDQKRIIVILPFILLYRIDDFLWSPMSVPFLKSIGVTKDQVAVINGVIGVSAAIVGGILGAIYLRRKGLAKGLWVLGIIQSCTLLLYAWLAWVLPTPLPEMTITSGGLALVTVINAFENMAYGLGAVAFVNFLMRTCKKEYSAVHYAIATGITALAATFAGFISGFIVRDIGFLQYFLFCFVCSIPGLVLLAFLPLKDLETER